MSHVKPLTSDKAHANKSHVKQRTSDKTHANVSHVKPLVSDKANKQLLANKLALQGKFNHNHHVMNDNTSNLVTVKNPAFNPASRVIARKQRLRSYARPVTEDEKMDTAQAIIAKVMRTLESNGLTLSATDKDDARQAGFLALVKIGYFESGIVNADTFRAISREIESRACLRLNATWEIATEFQTLEAIGVFHEYENTDKLTRGTRDAMKACFQALRMARDVSESRKASSEFKGHKSFLIACISTATGKGNVPPLNPATFRKRKTRFIKYLASGAKALHESKATSFDFASDICTNLEKNFLAN